MSKGLIDKDGIVTFTLTYEDDGVVEICKLTFQFGVHFNDKDDVSLWGKEMNRLLNRVKEAC